MIDPIRRRVQEIILLPGGSSEVTEGDLDMDDEDLRAEGFTDATPLEFHLSLAGLVI